MNSPAHGTAGGKVILLGEHAVVYGRPALVVGVPRRLTVTVRDGDGPRVDSPLLADDARPAELLAAVARHFGIAPQRVVATVDSELPAGAGFGSSAALVIATIRAVAAHTGTTITPPALLRLGRELEGLFHGVSSGVDPAAAALGGCFWYALEARGCVEASVNPANDTTPPFVGTVQIARALDLVIARRPGARRTGAAVGGVRERWLADRPQYEALFDAVAAVVHRGVAALRAGDLAALGAAFDENHGVLSAMGVSSPVVDELITVARGAGALGAKLTGGGAGGSILALTASAEPIVDALRAAGALTDVVHLTPFAEPKGVSERHVH